MYVVRTSMYTDTRIILPNIVIHITIIIVDINN